MDDYIVWQLFLLWSCIVLYMAPTIVAIFRRHRNTQSILVLNLFLGWTFVGWAVTLAFSVFDSGNIAHEEKRAAEYLAKIEADYLSRHPAFNRNA